MKNLKKQYPAHAIVQRYNYAYVDDSSRDNWYPYRNFKDNNEASKTKIGKRI